MFSAVIEPYLKPVFVRKILHFFCLFIFVGFVTQTYGQGIPTGSWRDHLPYSKGTDVIKRGNEIYTASSEALFIFNTADESITRLSKVEGLNSSRITAMAYSEEYDKVIVAYQDALIDVIEGKAITPYFDIQRFNIPVDRTINRILIYENMAFLSCGFGVAQFNIEREEFDGPFYIGDNGSPLAINELAILDSIIYAGTDIGLYSASLSSNLKDFNSWTKDAFISGKVNTLTSFGNKLIANVAGDIFNTDQAWILENGNWILFNELGTFKKNRFFVSSDRFYSTTYFSISSYDQNLSQLSVLSQSVVSYPIEPIVALYDNEGILWIVDGLNGLLKNFDEWRVRKIMPNGPNNSLVFDIDSKKKDLWLVPGGRNASFNNLFIREPISRLSANDTWVVLDGAYVDSSIDFSSVEIHPAANNPNIYIASAGRGLFVFNTDGNFVQKLDYSNSPLEESSAQGWTNLTDLEFDGSNNLWMVNEYTDNVLKVLLNNGTWLSFNLGANAGKSTPLGKLMIDNQGQKWIQKRNEGIVVFTDKGTLDNPNDDQVKVLGTQAGNGGLPSSTVLSMACDKDGVVWVGTNQGVATFFNPSRIFSGGNYDAQTILVQVDGSVGKLLAGEAVTSIAIDPGNRKWFGTSRSGVFLMSADGTKQIHHFTFENSPLLSNSIVCLEIDETTGELFIGTDKGVVSFRSDASKPSDQYDNVYAFPNPVRPDFEGTITITGLIENSNVKITDISGSIVYETKSEGGTATWNGRNFSGDKVATGVYLVLVNTPLGEESVATKILVVK
jgi:hypothetical protein